MEEVASLGYGWRTEVSKVAATVRPNGVDGRNSADPVFGWAKDRSDKLWREREERSEFGDGSGGWAAAATVSGLVVARGRLGSAGQ